MSKSPEANSENSKKMSRANSFSTVVENRDVLQVLQSLATKMEWGLSNDELQRLIRHPESFTPRVMFPKPSVPVSVSLPSFAAINPLPYGFSMEFWLELCRVEAQYDDVYDPVKNSATGDLITPVYTMMIFPPPSKEPKDIEHAFAKFGEELMKKHTINNIINKHEFFDICKKNAAFLLGGWV